MNAICHGDLYEEGATIMLEVCDDRVEKSNPGGLLPVIYMPNLEEEDEVCFKCGRYGSVGVEGLCSECREEQERILTSDD